MGAIQIVLDRELLQAADEAARRLKQNRSALMRDALRAHLCRLETQALEEQERAAYEKQPQDMEEVRFWEEQISWLQR
jgi:metal-responsive CopG/Arc/MetJ family transcriptional regulator